MRGRTAPAGGELRSLAGVYQRILVGTVGTVGTDTVAKGKLIVRTT